MKSQTQNQRGGYTPEEKQQIIEQWKQSGLSRHAFCRTNNLRYHTLIHWTRKPHIREKSKSTEFIPINIKSPTESIFAKIEAGGKQIQLYQPVTANFLKQLLRFKNYSMNLPNSNGCSLAAAANALHRLRIHNKQRFLFGELPSRPIEKGIPGPGLLAQIIIDKYVDHLPCYRQIQRYARIDDVKLSASTMSQWLKAGCSLLEPLCEVLTRQVLSQPYLHADETTIKENYKQMDMQYMKR